MLTCKLTICAKLSEKAHLVSSTIEKIMLLIHDCVAGLSMAALFLQYLLGRLLGWHQWKNCECFMCASILEIHTQSFLQCLWRCSDCLQIQQHIVPYFIWKLFLLGNKLCLLPWPYMHNRFSYNWQTKCMKSSIIAVLTIVLKSQKVDVAALELHIVPHDHIDYVWCSKHVCYYIVHNLLCWQLFLCRSIILLSKIHVCVYNLALMISVPLHL